MLLTSHIEHRRLTHGLRNEVEAMPSSARPRITIIIDFNFKPVTTENVNILDRYQFVSSSQLEIFRPILEVSHPLLVEQRTKLKPHRKSD